MDLIISEIIKEWGLFGAVFLGLIYLIWDNWRTNKNRKNNFSITNENIKNMQENMSERIEIVNQKINVVDEKVACMDINIHREIDVLRGRVDNLPMDNLNAINQHRIQEEGDHLKQIEDLMLLGGQIHQTMKEYTKLIGSDHTFIGSFHNGNSNLSGIPFCKFDIISECFCEQKIKHDHEFAFVYKDSDILRYGGLFQHLLQNDTIQFYIPKEGDTEMSKYEDIIWRRMKGLGIRRIAIKLLRDPEGVPSGFLGCVKYNDDELDIESLKVCGKELEVIYRSNKYKKQ